MNRPMSVPAVISPYAEIDPMPGEEHAGFHIDLRLILSILYRNWWLIAAIVGLSLLGGIAVTMLSTPVYMATSSIQIEQQTSKVLPGSTGDTGQDFASLGEADRFLQTQVDILKSRALADRVSTSLGLGQNARFLQAMRVKKLPAQGAGASAARRPMVVAQLMDNLDVNLPRNSRIVSLSFKSPDPVVAAKIANSYAQNFIESNLQRRFDASAYAREFLQNQLNVTKQRLEDSERAAIAYARSAGILDASEGMSGGGKDGNGGGVRSLVTSDLVQINDALIQAQARRVAAEERWNEASHTALLSLPEVQANASILQLSQQRAAAQAAYEQERQRHKADFPTMKQAAAQIASLDEQINGIAGHIRAGIRNEYDVARRQESALSSRVNGLKANTLAEQDRSVRYNILRREADTNRTMYDGLLQRFKEVSAAAGISSNNISMVDAAEPPVIPIKPRPLLNLALSGLVGLAIASLIVFARERFDDSIRSPDQVAAKLHIPLLNTIPRLAAGALPAEELANPRSAFSEAYFALRTSLRLSSAGGLPRSLLVTSTREGEGKSTTSMAIATSFAQIGMRVLLIDGDLRRPSLHRAFGTNTGTGLSNLLVRETTLSAVVEQTETPNLSLMTAGPIPPSPTELLSGTQLTEMVQEALESYDLVIIDAPPVLGLADAVLYSAVVDGVVYIVEAGRSNFGQVKTALRRLTLSGAKVSGAVLTKFDARSAGYYSDYQQNYYQY